MPLSTLVTLSEMQHRINCIREKMQSLNLGAVIACDASNARYATGFKGEPRSLLILPDPLILFTSFRTISWAGPPSGNLKKTRHKIQSFAHVNKRVSSVSQEITGLEERLDIFERACEKDPKDDYSNFTQRYPSYSLEDRLIISHPNFINLYVTLNYLDFERAGAQRSTIFKSA